MRDLRNGLQERVQAEAEVLQRGMCSEGIPKTEGKALVRYFERERMAWIAEMLRIYGFINRQHLMRKFEVSMPQASTDLNRYKRLHPGEIGYDQSTKRYVAIAPSAAPSVGEE